MNARTLLFTALTAAGLAVAARLAPISPTAPPLPPPPSPDNGNERLQPRGIPDQIADLPAFRFIAPLSPDARAEPQLDAAAIKFNGVVREGHRGLALLSTAGADAGLFAVGDRIGGWTVQKIHPTAILLQGHGQTVRKSLFESGAANGKLPSATARTEDSGLSIAGREPASAPAYLPSPGTARP